jgi:hypothetical protein
VNAPQPTEFLYTWYQDMDDQYPGEWWAHRISKITKKLVFVQYKVGGYLSRYPRIENMRLNRAELETKGETYWHHGRTLIHCFYTAEGKAQYELRQQSYQYIPECLKVLGLKLGATAIDVKHAYHVESLKHHPDAGGSHEAFLKLQDQYQAALRFVNSSRTTQS